MLTRADVEDFLYREAALLDDWRLDDWLSLWADDGRYVVPTSDAMDEAPDRALALLADDMVQLRARVQQLQTNTTWAEVPRSRTCHLISNVHIVEREAGRVLVRSAFSVHRSRGDRQDLYVGAYHHLLRDTGSGLKIVEKRVRLAHDSLRAQAKLSILL